MKICFVPEGKSTSWVTVQKVLKKHPVYASGKLAWVPLTVQKTAVDVRPSRLTAKPTTVPITKTANVPQLLLM